MPNARTAAPALPAPAAEHGASHLPGVEVLGYSLEIEDADGLVGDQASQTAFREVLGEWRARLEHAGRDPLGPTPSEEMGKDELDRIALSGDSEAARTVALAVAEFADRLAGVIQRMRKDRTWRGVEHIAIGGGFKESVIGRIAVRQAALRLQADGVHLPLRPVRHAADDAGLAGGLHLLPPAQARAGGAVMAVDIGGTNVRSGIVAFGGQGAAADAARVLQREVWRHADASDDKDLVEGIVAMLRRLLRHAQDAGMDLLPFVAVACPGLIRADGSIERGAQNLPADWRSASFHLPRRLQENIPAIGGQPTIVVMHNDAVVQGLSEIPYLDAGIQRWAVLTIGTGLGNASFERR